MERYLDHFREEHIEILQSKVLFRGMNRDEIRSFIVHANPVYVELTKVSEFALTASSHT